MPSVYALYNEEVVQGHREALAVLRELLAQETDPAERRKLANAILRARPAKDPKPQPAAKEQPAPAQTASELASVSSNARAANSSPDARQKNDTTAPLAPHTDAQQHQHARTQPPPRSTAAA